MNNKLKDISLALANKLPENVSRKICTAGLKMQKHMPTALVFCGVVGVVGGVILACKETLELEDIVGDYKEDKDIIDDARLHIGDDGEEYSELDYKKDTAINITKTAGRLVKLYAPSATIIGLSLGAILYSHATMQSRELAALSALSLSQKKFKEYRERIVEKYGKDVDFDIANGVKATKKSKSKNGDETIEIINKTGLTPEGISQYARFFDECTPCWSKDPGENLCFLRAKQAYANDLFKAQGYLFLNDVYDMLGFEKTPEGQVVGWIYKPNEAKVDNYVDFGIYNDVFMNQQKRLFINNQEASALLDFNVDGAILDLI